MDPMDQMGKLRPNFEPTNSTKSKQETRVAEPGGFDPDPVLTFKKNRVWIRTFKDNADPT